MDELLVEGAKLALQVFFTNMKVAGQTQSQIDAVYADELAKFEANNPNDLEETSPA